MEDNGIEAQMMLDVGITKKSLDFEASISAALINGSFEKAAELQANMARKAGLAAQGLGQNIDISI